MSSQKEVHSGRHAEQLKSKGAGSQRVCGWEIGNQGRWERPSRSLVVFRKSASKEEWKSYYSAGNADSSGAFYGLLAI